MKKTVFVFVFLFGAAMLAGKASAQTIPHVTGTFKTPEGKTPSAAGLKAMATIGATPVYGTIIFQPFDSSGNKPARILCGGITYVPQQVRGWIKGDGTLVDNYTAAAGVDLVPNAGCTPAGLVTRAFITLSPTPDGRVQSVTWTEDKTLPQQASIDWGSLAAAGVTAPTYIGYSTVQSSGANLTARTTVNFVNGGCVDNAVTLTTDCTFTGSTGGGPTLQTNGLNNASQTTLNFQTGAAVNGLTITPSNPSLGNEQLALSGALTDAGLASAYSGVGSCAANQFANAFTRNAAPGCALVSYAGLSGLPSTFAPSAHNLLSSAHGDTTAAAAVRGDVIAAVGLTPTWQRVAHPASSGGYFKWNGTDIVGSTGAAGGTGACAANQFETTDNGDAAPTCAQPAFSNLSGSLALAQTALTARGDLLTVNATPALARLAIGAANLYPKSNGTDVVYSTLAAGGVGSCAANQFTTALNADAAPTCAQPAYSGISGTPTLFYQTVQNASGLDQTQRGKVEFTGTAVASVTDDSANNRTVVTLTASAGSGVTLQTNGVNDSSQTALNLKSSAATNGLTLTQTNTAGGDVQLGLSGVLTVPGGGTGLATLAAHQLYVGNGTSSPAAVAAGASGQVLISGGAAADPAFADPVVSWNNGTAVTAAWTSATAVDTAATAALTVPNMSLVAVTLRATSTMTGGTLNFEADDGSGNFSFPISCDRVDTANVETTFALSATNKAWLCNVAAFSNFRVRLNPAITGTGTANIRITATTSPTPSEMTVQQAVAGALHVTVDAAPTTAITAASLPLPAGAATDASVTGLEVAQASTTSGQKGILGLCAATTSAPTYTTAQSDPLSCDTSGGLRVNVGSPTVTANIGTSGSLALDATLTGGNAKAQGNVASAAADSGNPIKIGGIFNTAQPTVTAGQRVDFQATARGAQIVATGVDPFSVSVASLPLPAGAATSANQPALLADNGAAAAANRVGVLPAIAQSQLPSPATAGRDVALRTDLNGTQLVGLMPVNISTFHAAKQGLVPAASPTDIAVLPGGATTTVIVTRVQLSCTQTTAGIIDVQLLKRSTADTLGTSAAMTVVPLDSSNSAAVSAPLSYTANPTTGTLVGAIWPMKVGALAPGTASPNDIYVWTPKYGQSIVLRGTAQQLAVNLNGVTLTGGSCDVSFDWIETTGL